MILNNLEGSISHIVTMVIVGDIMAHEAQDDTKQFGRLYFTYCDNGNCWDIMAHEAQT